MTQLYSHLKFLRFSEHLRALEERRMAAPVHVRIKPTNRCNHDCWYCAYHVSNLQLGEEMDMRDSIPREKMEELVDDLISMEVKAVTFSGGGEPLIYKGLERYVERLAENGVKVAAITNGSNLKGKIADAFARYGTWVRISLDAWDDPSYASARGISADAFSRLLENIRGFTARDTRCVLGVSFIVGKENHRHIEELCALMKSVGVNHVKLSGVVVGNSGEENNRYHEEIKEEVARQIECAKRLESDGFSVIDHYHELPELFEKSYTTCPYLMFLTVIGADCNVYTCQDKAYTDGGRLGSIAERPFREFWYSDANRERVYTFDPSINCRHHCVTNSKNLALLDYLSLEPGHSDFV